jgi:tetratricopeptide (TPR) repeat protein
LPIYLSLIDFYLFPLQLEDILLSQIALFFFVFSNLVLGNLPAEGEISFAKASLAFQEGNKSEASAQINELLKSYPDEPQVLELQALLKKSENDWKSSKKLYLKLLTISKKAGVEHKIPLYAFELGNISYQEGDFSAAHRYLRTAVRGGFNVEASEFLLGKIDLERNRWTECREHFETASKSQAFSSASKLYIAQAYSKENRTSDALGAYVDAKESALANIRAGQSISEQSRFLAQQVLKNSEQELRSFSKSEWIKEVAFATSYDSNVLFMPNLGDAANSSSQSSLKQSASWRLRYATDPTEPWQYLGSYGGSINYNFNRETERGQFLNQDFSNFITKGFLKPTHYGFKIGGTGIFQFQTDAYKPFNLTGSIGPFAKVELNDTWSLGLEAFFQPGRNFLDPGLSESAKRSGWDLIFRAYLASRENTVSWNPSIFFTGTLLRPTGSDFSGTRLNIDFTNSMYLSQSLFLAQTVGVSASHYPNRSNGVRDDKGVSAGLSGGIQLSQGLALLGHADYGHNFSNDSNFGYNRWSTTLSGSYRF